MEKYSLHAARASRMENVYPAGRIKGIACAGRIRIQRVSWHKAGPEHSQNDQTAAPKSQGQNRLQGTWPEVQARRKQRSESSLYGIRRQTAAVIRHSGVRDSNWRRHCAIQLSSRGGASYLSHLCSTT